MRISRFLALVIALSLAGAVGNDAFGQRTVNSALMLTAEYSYPFSGNGDDFCLDLCCGQYQLNSYWNAGITGNLYSHDLKNESMMQYAQIAAIGEWMYRLVGTRNRAVNLYLGGGMFIGYEAYDPFGKLPEYFETGLGVGSFLYGIHAKLEGEFFIWRNVAIVLGGRLPVNFTSPVSKLNYHVSAGLRINLK